jgi:hypothetical protein
VHDLVSLAQVGLCAGVDSDFCACINERRHLHQGTCLQRGLFGATPCVCSCVCVCMCVYVCVCSVCVCVVCVWFIFHFGNVECSVTVHVTIYTLLLDPSKYMKNLTPLYSSSPANTHPRNPTLQLPPICLKHTLTQPSTHRLNTHTTCKHAHTHTHTHTYTHNIKACLVITDTNTIKKSCPPSPPTQHTHAHTHTYTHTFTHKSTYTNTHTHTHLRQCCL